MTIKNKMISSHLLISLFAIVIVFFSIKVIHLTEERYAKVTDETIPMIETIQKIKSAIHRIVSSTTEAVLVDRLSVFIESDEAVNSENDLIQSSIQDYESAMTTYAEYIKVFPNEKYLFDAIKENGQLLISTSKELSETINKVSSNAEIYELKEKFEKYEMSTFEVIDAALAYEGHEIIERKKSVESILNNSVIVLIVTGGIASLVAIVFGFVSSGFISSPIRKLNTAMNKIGRGDLTVKTEIESNDEIGNLSIAFNKMAVDLREYDEALKMEIAERKQTEDKMHQYHNRLELILDSSGEGIYGLDLDGNTTFVNPAAAKMIGWDAEDLIGKNQHEILHHTKQDGTPYPQKECPIYAAMKDGSTTEVNNEIFWRKDGSSFPVEYISTPMMDVTNNIIGAVVTFMDVTERKETEQELHQMAYYDQLTNLPNRINFLVYLERMLKRTKFRSDYLFAVLFIDLDRFKLVNDSLGHIIGDKLLVEIARRLEASIRATDTISRVAGSSRVARFGGDEFALFLNDIKDISSATRVANRIQDELQKPVNIDGHELYTSASIGIALSASGYERAEDILRDADSAMYRAKATGRAHAEIFDDEMHKTVTEVLQLESDLRVAVEEEQFMIYYQPIVSAADSWITGAEALIRWNHPEQGLISPMDFIPIAEEIGLISTIGEWVLKTACAQNKTWQDAGYPNLLMKVNFSSRQFKDENLTEIVTKVIKETGMPAQLLDVEITESIAMADTSIRTLNQLTAMGLHTSIDDFGTGYSSLGSLTRFPINTIKIDRTFIKDITIDVNAEAIIKAIIAMAHSLKMEVVAEGVETEEQLAFLQSEKCDKIQGYLFSRPVPEEEFRKLLEQNKISPSPINKHSASIL
jgi:diguanylate cyclase (GGDEF)-like protein/PAS domain S-box-containing protein